MSLKFYHRMFAARLSLTTREAYLSLVGELDVYFRREEASPVTLAMGLDPMDDRWQKLLMKVCVCVCVKPVIFLPSYSFAC